MDTVKSKTRKHVTCEQMDMMLEFLQQNVELAKGQNRGGRGRILSLKLWNQCAKKLNNIDGTVKDGKGWAKYWCDWKFRVRRKALEIRAAKENNEEDPGSLSTMEQVLVGIIGEQALDTVVIKTDPLSDGNAEENNYDDNEEGTSTNEHYGSGSKSTRSRRRRKSSTASESDYDEPNDEPEEKPTRRKSRRCGNVDTDAGEHAQRFLRLEEKNLEALQSLRDSAQSIAASMIRLVDEITNMRNILMNNIRNGVLH